MTEHNLPWYRRVRRWGQTNLTEEDPKNCDLEFWREQWRRTAVQGVIINCGGIVAYYPSRFSLQYRAALLEGRDYYGEFNKAAREAGLAVVARMDINRATREFFEAHPSWFCRHKDGSPIMSQGRYFSCVNSGYYKEYIPSVLREIIERYHPDGFSDNSWKGLGRNTICYCDNCRRRFREDCNEELPEKVDWNDPVYRKWVRWSYGLRTENWDLFNETTRKYGGEDCLWLGMLNADVAGSCQGFADLKALCARSKVIFSDHQSREIISGFEQNSLNGMLFKLASPSEDVEVPESMANYVRGHRAFRLAANPAAETRTWIAEGIAGGITPWFHHVGGGRRDRRQFDTPVPMFQWHKENEEYLYGRENLANVAVVWSQQNHDFYGRDNIDERCSYPLSGFCRALSSGRIPFLPVHAGDIGRYKDRIATLILPDIAVLTDNQTEEICSFLDRGGNLVLTGQTGSLDEDGNKRRDNRLLNRLGLKLGEEFFGASGDQTASWEYYDMHNYLLLPKDRHQILKGFEKTDILAFGGGFYRAESTGPLKPIAGYIPAFPIYPPEFSWIREERPELGTIFAGTLDSGGRVVYFAADIDRCFGREHLPDHRELLLSGVRYAAGESLPVNISGPGRLDCTIYRQGDRRVLHLVNLTDCSINPGYCEGAAPIGPIKVSLPVKSSGDDYRAELRVSGGRPGVTVKDGRIEIVIERIEDHELLVVE